jgi:hypothetical protein
MRKTIAIAIASREIGGVSVNLVYPGKDISLISATR